MPASASAAPCPGGSTEWVGPGNGSFGEAANWSNGAPSGSCDVAITKPGSYTVTMTSGAVMKSFTLGGTGSTPTLVISDQSPNTNLDATTTGITIAAGASVVLTCVSACGGPHLNSGSAPLNNAGTIEVDPNSGPSTVVAGVIANTGTIAFKNAGGTPYSASLSGQVTNQGAITVGDGGNVINTGSSCGGTEPFVKNDVGGTISGSGTGVLSVVNFKQGDGISEDVFIPCGSLEYSGDGTSSVQAGGGFNLTGEMQVNQALTVSADSNNTNAVLQGDFTSNGSITLTCQAGGCSGSGGGSGGGVGFNANGHVFTNAGTFTFAAASGTNAGVSGGMINTGTVRLDQTGSLGGPVEQTGAGAEIFVSPGTSLNAGEPVKLKAGALRGGGTVNGSVENSGGVVAPGASPGTLTLTGSYVQGAGGRLDIEVAGTGAGQFDSLAIGGAVTLGGTLALIPTAGFGDSSAIGDSVSFLTYGSTVNGGFAATTVNPALACPKQLTVSQDAGLKALKATVTSSGANCGGGGGAVTPIPPIAPTPTPKAPSCGKGKQLKKGKCVAKKCPKGKKRKHGRCVKKKQPKAKVRSRRF